jgi:hypothetical protein
LSIVRRRRIQIMYDQEEVGLLLLQHCYDCTATTATTNGNSSASTASTPASTASSMLSDCRDY